MESCVFRLKNEFQRGKEVLWEEIEKRREKREEKVKENVEVVAAAVVAQFVHFIFTGCAEIYCHFSPLSRPLFPVSAVTPSPISCWKANWSQGKMDFFDNSLTFFFFWCNFFSIFSPILSSLLAIAAAGGDVPGIVSSVGKILRGFGEGTEQQVQILVLNFTVLKLGLY